MPSGLLRLLLPFASSLISSRAGSGPRGPFIALYMAAGICALASIVFLLLGLFLVLRDALGAGQAALATGGIALLIAGTAVAIAQAWRGVRRRRQSDLLSALLDGDGGKLMQELPASLGEGAAAARTLIRENPAQAVAIGALLGLVAGASGVFRDD